jgi:hypothetical protein
VMLCAERAAPPVARGEFARAAPPCMTEMGTRSGRGSVGIALHCIGASFYFSLVSRWRTTPPDNNSPPSAYSPTRQTRLHNQYTANGKR